MGILAKLGLLKNKDRSSPEGVQSELSTLKMDGRLHHRIKITDPTLVSLTLADTPTLRVIDLSYGGIAILLPANPMASTGALVTGRLHTLNRFVDLNLTLMRSSPFREIEENQVLAAFRVIHEDSAPLLFLRQFIEPSRSGESLAYIAPTMRQVRYNHQDWHCLRGEGPVDLLLRCEPNSVTPAEFLLTFRIQDSYWDLGYRNGQLSTGQAANSNTSALDRGVDSVINSAELNPYVLRTAIFILSSCSTTYKELMQPIIELAKWALNSSTKRN
jgi:hypothetical protein